MRNLLASRYSAVAAALLVAGLRVHAGDATYDNLRVNKGFNQGTGNQVYSNGYAFVAGGSCIATVQYAHAEGTWTRADGYSSHAECGSTHAGGYYSHAEGGYSETTEDWAHAEGYGTLASADAAHAEGAVTVASGPYSHAEGYACTASVTCAHAEGYLTVASGTCAHAEGWATIAGAEASHSGGRNCEVLEAHTNAFIHAAGASTNDLKQTAYPFTAHFDRLHLFEASNDHSNSVLARWEMDARYARQEYLAPLGDLAMGSYTNQP